MRLSPRRSLRRLAFLPVLALAVGLLSAVGQGGTATAATSYTVRTLHFKVAVGPRRDQVCDLIGDLYLPVKASPTNRVPAILTTNGFGGSKEDQAGIGRAFSARGYAVLAYSGLGFGGSGCKVTLDDPDWDGVAGSQLISYLGGASGIAFTDADHTRPAPNLRVVRRDRIAHNGKRLPNDPRVGMLGGSYGGQIQFAIASVDPRLDAIVPIITWSDLSYALGPNNTSQTSGVRTAVPGATKMTWGLGLTAVGVTNGLANVQTDPKRLFPCPNFATFVCPALVTAGTLGYFDPASQAALRHASVSSYIKKIRIPTLLVQGQNDTLFNLNEGLATYRALQAQGTEVKMIWQWWGHSISTPAPGEIDLSRLNPRTQYETGRIAAWFARYLQDRPVSTGPEFAYFRNWITYSGNARPAYGTSSRVRVGTPRPFYLSGTGLRSSRTGLATGTQSFATAPAGLPNGLTALDAISYLAALSVPEAELPGTSASWTSGRLGSKLDVVGTPRLRLKVFSPSAAATQGVGPAGMLVLFVRLQDVGPDGKAQNIRNLTAPVRIADVTKPFTVTLPAFVHRFRPGHRIKLVVSAGSLNYRGGLGANLVRITTGSSSQVLTLPVVR